MALARARTTNQAMCYFQRLGVFSSNIIKAVVAWVSFCGGGFVSGVLDSTAHLSSPKVGVGVCPYWSIASTGCGRKGPL